MKCQKLLSQKFIIVDILINISLSFFFFHRRIYLCFRRGGRSKSTGSLVDRLVHRFIRRPRRFFPHRQLFGMVLSSWWKVTIGPLFSTKRRDQRTGSNRNTTPTLSFVRATLVRFCELWRDNGQDFWREGRHICDISATSQTCGTGTSLNFPRRDPRTEDTGRIEMETTPRRCPLTIVCWSISGRNSTRRRTIYRF